MSSRPFQIIHLSPTAKEGLKYQAFLLGYVRSMQNKNYNGLSGYINAIASCELQDTRPDDIREYHSYMDVPNWSCEEYRPQNKFRLSPRAILKLYEFGLEHDITDPRRLQEKPPAVTVIGYVLEAIGIEWLTPINPPRKPNINRVTIHRE